MLKNINSHISDNIDHRLKLKEKNKNMKKITPIEKFNILYNFCNEKKRLPKYKEGEYMNIKLGYFIYGILSGSHYKNHRDEWLSQLKAISPEIKDEIERRTK